MPAKKIGSPVRRYRKSQRTLITNDYGIHEDVYLAHIESIETIKPENSPRIETEIKVPHVQTYGTTTDRLHAPNLAQRARTKTFVSLSIQKQTIVCTQKICSLTGLSNNESQIAPMVVSEHPRTPERSSGSRMNSRELAATPSRDPLRHCRQRNFRNEVTTKLHISRKQRPRSPVGS